MSETIPLSSVEASAGFWELADPAKRLKDSIQTAFQNGSLELWLMGSRPPTPEECRVGYQFLRGGTDDMPLPDSITWALNRSSVNNATIPHNLPAQFIHTLKSEEWLTIDAAMGIQTPPDTLLSLVPSSAVDGTGVSNVLTRTVRNSYYAGGIRGDSGDPLIVRWALLRSGGGMGPNETTWITTRVRQGRQTTWWDANGVEGPVIVDFRDGLPLTVGPRDSNANLRIGEIHRWSPRAEVFSIHVPLPIVNQPTGA